MFDFVEAAERKSIPDCMVPGRKRTADPNKETENQLRV